MKKEELIKILAGLDDKKITEMADKREKAAGRLGDRIVSWHEISETEESTEETILQEYLNGLSDQELNVLVGVMYYGRECATCGDGYVEQVFKDCEGIYETLQALVPHWPNWSRERALEKLSEKICLGEYLERGFTALEKLRKG